MAKYAEFGEALAAARKARGFATPYSFCRSRELGISLVNYLRMERGLSLPKAWRLEHIFSALGLLADSSEAQNLLSAYVRAVIGGKLFGALRPAGVSSDPAPASWMMAETAARQALRQRAIQLTNKQYETISLKYENYACHVVLANTKGGLAIPELVKATGLSKAAVLCALASLKTAGLAVVSGQRASSPLAGQYVVPPAPTPAFAKVWGTLRRYRAIWVEKHGKLANTSYLLLRARKGEFQKYFNHLADVVSLSAIYGSVDPAEDSELYLVEASVHSLLAA